MTYKIIAAIITVVSIFFSTSLISSAKNLSDNRDQALTVYMSQMK